MKELPVLVLLKILDHLPTVDAIRYRVVCKSWRDLIDQFVLNELNVFHERQCTKYLQLQKCFMNLNRSISFNKHFLERLVYGNEKFAFLFRNLKKFSFQQHQYWRNSSKKFGKLKKLISMFTSHVWHTRGPRAYKFPVITGNLYLIR